MAQNSQASLSIAMVGTRGVPARYGGFETCVEEVGRRLVDRGHRVVVYCRGAVDDKTPNSYLGMELVHRKAMRKRSLETISHTGLSTAHLLRNRTDVALVFNAANAPFLPVMRAARIPVATHVDGLEWKRAKWGAAGQRYYQLVERMAVWWSNALIADASGIADYYRDKFDAATDLIAYGAPDIADIGSDRLARLGLEKGRFHLVVARFEPENHVLEIVQGYVRSAAALPLVVVGSAPYAGQYTAAIGAAADERVRLLGGIWDAELLDQLYAGARTYLHGHSVGGTNPSLLRAIGAGAATTAFDVVFNREVLGDAGRYFATPEELTELVEQSEVDDTDVRLRKSAARQRARAYDWDEVADRYEELCRRLASRSPGSTSDGNLLTATRGAA
ncbi:MAG: DUF1972 domain-containing protein [Nakamurella sp.]